MSFQEKCKLCNKPCEHFAKSHLIPWGFQSRCEWANDMSLVSVGSRSRRMRKGVYDEHILCDGCEHDYFHDPDTYAIEIFRDHKGGIKQEVCFADGRKCLYYIFRDVNRRLLRAFFASVLWRCSVSNLECVSSVRIGKRYEERITNDLKNKGFFNWIDAIGIVFDSDNQDVIIQGMNDGFVLPEKTQIKYANRVANGYNIYLPKMKFCVSLDQRINPFAIMGDELARFVDGFENVSPSLAQDNDGKDFVLFESEFPISLARKIMYACRNEPI